MIKNINQFLNVNKQYSHKTVAYICNVTAINRRYTQEAARVKEGRWDLFSAVSLERKPVIARKLTPIEEEVSNIFKKFEFERSYKSDHEVRIITEKIKIEKLKKRDSDLDMDSLPETSAQDFEDASSKELKDFVFSSTETEADRKHDVKSIERKLDRSLLLIIKENLGENPMWVLPQGIRQEGETLRQTAERVLIEKCGPELKVDIFGNAPVGFYKYKYPKSIISSDSAIGAKIFFFKAQLKSGNVQINTNTVTDYQWATQKELCILPIDYHKSIKMFTINEEH